MSRRLAFVMLLLLAPFLVASPAFSSPADRPAPDFEISNLDGKKVRLSDFKGRFILLKLATTWCPSCKQLSDELADIGDYLTGIDAVLVEVFLQDSPEMVRTHLQSQKYTMPHVALLDNGSAQRAYNVYLIPRILVIDEDFKIRRDDNMITGYDLKRRLQELRKGT